MAPRKRSVDSSKAEGDKIHPSVKSVQRVGPTHAQGLQNLVGLYANIRQGEPCDQMRLDFEMTCGEAPMRVGSQDFRLGLRTCFVSLKRENCQIRVGSLYEHGLEAGAYKSKATEREAIEKQSQAGASASGDIGVSAGMSLKARLAAGFSFGRKKRKTLSTEITNQQNTRIELIAASGQDRWQLGNSIRGDARRTDGMLIGAYFNEVRGEDGDPHPLCVIERTVAEQRAEINIRASAPLGSLIVKSTQGEPTEAAIKDTHAQLRRRGASAARDHSAAEEKLRSQIAGLVVGKALRKAQLHGGAQLEEGTFLIAQQTLIINGSDETS